MSKKLPDKVYTNYKAATTFMKKYPGLRYKRKSWGTGYVYYDDTNKEFFYIRFVTQPGVISMSKQKFIPSFSDMTINDWIEVAYSESEYFNNLKGSLQE